MLQEGLPGSLDGLQKCLRNLLRPWSERDEPTEPPWRVASPTPLRTSMFTFVGRDVLQAGQQKGTKPPARRLSGRVRPGSSHERPPGCTFLSEPQRLALDMDLRRQDETLGNPSKIGLVGSEGHALAQSQVQLTSCRVPRYDAAAHAQTDKR